MTQPSPQRKELQALRGRLEEAEADVRAIRAGEVDALLIGEQVYILQGAETPYRSLVESINEGAATLLRDGTLLYCNRRLSMLLNEPLERLIGSPFHRFLAPCDRTQFLNLLGDPVGETCKAEFLIERPGAEPLPLQLTLGPLEVEGTKAVSMVATDLTEQKRAEEARFASILASICDAVVATDAGGLITFLNPAAVELTGWRAEEALGRPVLDVVQFLNEGGRFDPGASVKLALSGSAVLAVPSDVLLVRKEGSAVPVDGTIAPVLHPGGKCAGTVLALRDVTDYRRLEAELSNALGDAREHQQALELLREELERAVKSMEILVASTIDSKLLIDGGGTILCSSPRAAASLGSTPHELKGAPCTRFLPEEELLGARLALSDLLQNPGVPGTVTLQLRTQAGDLAWFSLRATQVSFGSAGGFLVDVERVSL